MDPDPDPALHLRDIVVFVTGLVVVVWGLWASSTVVTSVGAVVAVIGAILPLRSLGRRVSSSRADSD